jgi:hypothetical protein
MSLFAIGIEDNERKQTKQIVYRSSNPIIGDQVSGMEVS